MDVNLNYNEMKIHIPLIIFFKWAKPGLFFVYFRPFLITISIIQIEKIVDGVLALIHYGVDLKENGA